MARRCKIIVCYINGTVEEYYGGLHADEKLLRIYPPNGCTVSIPLVSIKKYITKED